MDVFEVISTIGEFAGKMLEDDDIKDLLADGLKHVVKGRLKNKASNNIRNLVFDYMNWPLNARYDLVSEQTPAYKRALMSMIDTNNDSFQKLFPNGMEEARAVFTAAYPPDIGKTDWESFVTYSNYNTIELGNTALDPINKRLISELYKWQLEVTELEKHIVDFDEIDISMIIMKGTLVEWAMVLLPTDFSYIVHLDQGNKENRYHAVLTVQNGIEPGFVLDRGEVQCVSSLEPCAEAIEYVLSRCSWTSSSGLDDYTTALWTRAAESDPNAPGPKASDYDFEEILTSMHCSDVSECVQISEQLGDALSRHDKEYYMSSYSVESTLQKNYLSRKRGYAKTLTQERERKQREAKRAAERRAREIERDVREHEREEARIAREAERKRKEEERKAAAEAREAERRQKEEERKAAAEARETERRRKEEERQAQQEAKKAKEEQERLIREAEERGRQKALEEQRHQRELLEAEKRGREAAFSEMQALKAQLDSKQDSTLVYNAKTQTQTSDRDSFTSKVVVAQNKPSNDIPTTSSARQEPNCELSAWNIADLAKIAMIAIEQNMKDASLISLGTPLLWTGSNTPLTYFSDDDDRSSFQKFDQRVEYAFSTLAVAATNTAAFCALLSASKGGSTAENNIWLKSIPTCLRLVQISSAYYLNVASTPDMVLPSSLFDSAKFNKELLGEVGETDSKTLRTVVETGHVKMEVPMFTNNESKAALKAESKRLANLSYDEWLDYSGLRIVDESARTSAPNIKAYSRVISRSSAALGNIAAASKMLATGFKELPPLPVFSNIADELENAAKTIHDDPDFKPYKVTRKAKRAIGAEWMLPSNIFYDPAYDNEKDAKK